VLEAHRQRGPTFLPGGRTDVVHVTTLPWVHFRSISHARSHRTGGSVPKIALGRYLEREAQTLMPVSLEVNHALVDGLHVGRFFEHFQHALQRPVAARAHPPDVPRAPDGPAGEGSSETASNTPPRGSGSW
jgi:chloramphenicol O-acetyltransferase